MNMEQILQLQPRKLTEEHRTKIGNANRGKKRPPFTEEHKIKISLKRQGRKPMLGKTHSEETKRKIRDKIKGMFLGEKSYRWKGGVNSINHRVRHLNKYHQWRLMVFLRDDFICKDCGLRGCYLEAHHLKSFTSIMDDNKIKTIEQAENCKELWDINNGKSLCKRCHNKTKGKGTY